MVATSVLTGLLLSVKQIVATSCSESVFTSFYLARLHSWLAISSQRPAQLLPNHSFKADGFAAA
jgi:hypothetical protein